MKRRKFLLGTGAAAAGGASLLGSRAFTSVNAARRLTVKTAGDNTAFLRLKQLGDGNRSLEDGTPEKVEFSFPGLDERIDNPDLGLGADSVYEFDRDTNESNNTKPTEGLLRIENQGTQLIEVYSAHHTDSNLEIELYDVTDPNKTALRNNPGELAIGEKIDVGFRIRTFGSSIGTFDETLTIVGEEPNK